MLESENIDIAHPSDGHAAHDERAILSLQRLHISILNTAVIQN